MVALKPKNGTKKNTTVGASRNAVVALKRKYRVQRVGKGQ